MRIKILLFILFSCTLAFGQGGTATNIRNGANLPNNCTYQIFIKTADSLYWCGSTANSWFKVTTTIASGTTALGTSAIASAACANVVTVTATGALTTDNIAADFNADPTSTTGYGPSTNGTLTIYKYITAGNVNFKVCNSTSASVTPGAASLSWRVIR